MRKLAFSKSLSRNFRGARLKAIMLLVVSLALTSCSKPKPSAIIGRWHQAGAIGVIEFHEDGTIEVSDGKTEVSGKYGFITPGKLRIEFNGSRAAPGPRVYRVDFASDKRSWIGTDVDGEKTAYERLR